MVKKIHRSQSCFRKDQSQWSLRGNKDLKRRCISKIRIGRCCKRKWVTLSKEKSKEMPGKSPLKTIKSHLRVRSQRKKRLSIKWFKHQRLDKNDQLQPKWLSKRSRKISLLEDILIKHFNCSNSGNSVYRGQNMAKVHIKIIIKGKKYYMEVKFLW